MPGNGSSSRGRSGDGRLSGLLSSCLGPCLLNAIATSWVDMWHAMRFNSQALQEENNIIRMGALQRDLDSSYQRLALREGELQSKVTFLAQQAITARRQNKMDVAKRKMMERSRVLTQLDHIQNSMSLIDVHRSTIEKTTLDISLLETIKASGDALKTMGVNAKGTETVDKIVTEVDSSLRTAAEISSMLAFGNPSGMADPESIYGAAAGVDPDDLMAELEDMLTSTDGDASAEAEHAAYGNDCVPHQKHRPHNTTFSKAYSAADHDIFDSLPRVAEDASFYSSGTAGRKGRIIAQQQQQHRRRFTDETQDELTDEGDDDRGRYATMLPS